MNLKVNLKQNFRPLFLTFILAGVSFFQSTTTYALSDNTRPTYPTAIVLELGGRGLLYSISIDRVLTEDFVVGLGIGTAQTRLADGATNANTTATLIPAYVNYYFMRAAGSIFVTGGATLVANSGSVQDLKTNPAGLQLNNTPLQLTLGVGYELRSDAGFLFRATGYGIIAGSFAPWMGLSVGYTF